jgi:hypothetical protein
MKYSMRPQRRSVPSRCEGGERGKGNSDVTGCLASYGVRLFSCISGRSFLVVTAVKGKIVPVLN